MRIVNAEDQAPQLMAPTKPLKSKIIIIEINNWKIQIKPTKNFFDVS